MKNLLNYILMLSCFISISVSGQEKKIQTITFTLKAAPNEPVPDSIQVAFFKGIINSSIKNFESIKVRKNHDNSFNFSISTEQTVSPFQLWIYYPTKRNEKNIEILNTPTYYAEPSDQIEISVSKGSPMTNITTSGNLVFSGKGAVKYRVTNLLKEMKENLYQQEVSKAYNLFGGNSAPSTGKIESKDYHKSAEFTNYFDSLFGNVQKNMAAQKDTLNKYEGVLSKEISTQMSNDLISPIAFINVLHWVYKAAKTEDTKQAIADFYFSKINLLEQPEPKNYGFYFGMSYTWVKGLELMHETYYKSKGQGFPFQTLYNVFKANSNTYLRDILIIKLFEEAAYFQRYVNNSDTRDSCLNDAFKFVKEPELRSALNYQLLFSKGSKMPDFSFPDTLGNKTNLKDLKGKVYILDFYFEGCGSCAVFAKRFENYIFPQFEGNPNFKVLSINTDLTRKRWINAIKSGKYTQPTSINLSTGSAGYNHPILKYYGINAFPWIVLVDKNGQVLAFNLYSLSSEEIVRIIKNALNDKPREKNKNSK